MPSITNVGGSLTSALALTLLAWSVRWVRSRALLKRQQSGGHDSERRRSLGRFFAPLSPAALAMLVETDPTAHLLFDVRGKEAWEAAPLAGELRGAHRLEVSEVEDALSSPGAWRERMPGLPFPHADTLLVFLADDEGDALDAAAVAASKGFQRTSVLRGGVAAWGGGRGGAVAGQLQFIGRDALALLLGAAAGAEGAPPARAPPGVPLIDVRRHDERALYGSIPGAHHLPVDQMASALALPPDAFREAYRFDKPGADSPFVLQCRTHRRSSWGALLAAEAGLRRCYVYREGSYGWRLSRAVQAYRSYEPGDVPPEPEEFAVEQVDVRRGLLQLQQLGLPTPAVGGAA